MRDLDVRNMRTRIKGRAALMRSLQGLYLRVHKFGTLRAEPGSDDYRWALHTCTGLDALLPPGDTETRHRTHGAVEQRHPREAASNV